MKKGKCRQLESCEREQKVWTVKQFPPNKWRGREVFGVVTAKVDEQL